MPIVFLLKLDYNDGQHVVHLAIRSDHVSLKCLYVVYFLCAWDKEEITWRKIPIHVSFVQKRQSEIH